MAQQLEALKAHLAVVKKSPADKIQEDFYQFMIKAKDGLGETSYPMAQFYFQYGHFILQKQEANLDLFNQAAVPKNVHEDQEEEFENIPEDFDQDSSQQLENQSPNVPQVQVPEDKVQLRDDQPQIIGEDQEKVDEPGEPSGAQNEDDKVISAMNLQMAVTLYQEQLQKIKSGCSSTSIDEVLDGLRRARTRLGDLYMNDENYAKSVEYYQKVIELQSEREGFQCNRLVSQIYYLIGNAYLYENKPGCEIKANSEYIKATNTLLNHLNLTLNYDISGFDIPTQQKAKVDRYPYLSVQGDSAQVIQIKEIISCLLDKIEDAESQIAVRESYEKEKKKIQDQKNLSQFKPVQDKTKVINLGTFGNRNRKKMPEDESKPATPFKLNGEINQSAETQVKKIEQTEKEQAQKKPHA